jgi:hypothetical protein
MLLSRTLIALLLGFTALAYKDCSAKPNTIPSQTSILATVIDQHSTGAEAELNSLEKSHVAIASSSPAEDQLNRKLLKRELGKLLMFSVWYLLGIWYFFDTM